MEAVELILEAGIRFDCIEESLLHAISKGAAKFVRIIIEHPNYIAGLNSKHEPSPLSDDQSPPPVGRYRRTCRRDANGQIVPPSQVTSQIIVPPSQVHSLKDPFFRTDEKSQFSPDITPLILAAHYNSHEIVQMFIARGQTIVRPHAISCHCADCVTKQNYDSLKRSRSRLNAYRALASPAYMALSSPDPIMATFELRQEMKKLAQVEKEFKVDVEICLVYSYFSATINVWFLSSSYTLLGVV